MSQRSPQNQRNVNGGAGVARKSASSAKPARAAAANVHVVPASAKDTRKAREAAGTTQNMTKEEKKAAKQARRDLNDRIQAVSNIFMSSDPQYKRLRRTWWGMLIVGLLCVLISWLMIIPNNGGVDLTANERVIAYSVLALAYVSIFAALIFDFMKIRPIRNAARAKAEGLPLKKLNAVLEEATQKVDADRAAREAQKEARRNK